MLSQLRGTSASMLIPWSPAWVPGVGGFGVRSTYLWMWEELEHCDRRGPRLHSILCLLNPDHGNPDTKGSTSFTTVSCPVQGWRNCLYRDSIAVCVRGQRLESPHYEIRGKNPSCKRHLLVFSHLPRPARADSFRVQMAECWVVTVDRISGQMEAILETTMLVCCIHCR